MKSVAFSVGSGSTALIPAPTGGGAITVKGYHMTAKAAANITLVGTDSVTYDYIYSTNATAGGIAIPATVDTIVFSLPPNVGLNIVSDSTGPVGGALQYEVNGGGGTFGIT